LAVAVLADAGRVACLELPFGRGLPGRFPPIDEQADQLLRGIEFLEADRDEPPNVLGDGGIRNKSVAAGDVVAPLDMELPVVGLPGVDIQGDAFQGGPGSAAAGLAPKMELILALVFVE